ncbi:hypothetical protein EDD18DRAFT_704803 [Armillaria luteobubalina]|uniref:Uncharacterized protein n=1 Tax=Armillaria luteobubalina TaxID=153913 RepID=A0AA39PKB7_9AGAR|nr:hypothetical protein EDD18DRAFT_704803 [Armillaria luteobubalina]
MYDIAKNEDGPLWRTMKKTVGEKKADEAESPALLERIASVETYLAYLLRSASLPARIGFLEHNIIRLEKEYPPWAALHFNEPRRNCTKAGNR